MKKMSIFIVLIVLVSTLGLSGCGRDKVKSCKDAIETAKTMNTTKEKTDYLISQAKVAYEAGKLQAALGMVQYVLRYVDSDSQEAKELHDKAEAELTAQVKRILAEIEKKP